MNGDKFNVVPSSLADLDFILGLFENARAYQAQKGYDLWPQFSHALITAEIAEKRHWKILDGQTIACVFSVLYQDPIIWKERNQDPSVYLHRIAVNPLYKGQEIVKYIRSWAIAHAKQLDKKYVRMDTWGNNKNLRNYYIQCGFNYIGQQSLDYPEAHYGGSVLSLFEIPVKG